RVVLPPVEHARVRVHGRLDEHRRVEGDFVVAAQLAPQLQHLDLVPPRRGLTHKVLVAYTDTTLLPPPDGRRLAVHSGVEERPARLKLGVWVAARRLPPPLQHLDMAAGAGLL